MKLQLGDVVSAIRFIGAPADERSIAQYLQTRLHYPRQVISGIRPFCDNRPETFKSVDGFVYPRWTLV